MTDEQMKLIPELFDQALEQPSDKRELFLKQACAGNDQLFQAVKSLLDSHDETGSFLEHSAIHDAAKLYAAETSKESLSAGNKLGRYEIIGPLGRGGMGEVYIARDDLSREVAIKILPDNFSRTSERIARFEREAQTLARLNHPNIAQIYGREESNGRRFLVLEFVKGETLAARLAREKLSVKETLNVFGQIADALTATHESGILHRDLKPANIMLTTKGTVKLLDFGIAKHLRTEVLSEIDLDTLATNKQPTETLTQTGITPGTVAYMSPELFTNQNGTSTIDSRGIDLWAFGLVMFESLTSAHPFKRQTSEETKNAILKLEPDWNLLPFEVPSVIEKLLRDCLKKDPQQRLCDANQARLRIEAAANPTLTASLREKYRLTPLRIKAAMLSALLLALVIAFFGTTKFSSNAFRVSSNQAAMRLAVVAWIDEGETKTCEPNQSKAIAKLLQDKLRGVRGLQIVTEPESTTTSERSLPLLKTDLSQLQIARTQGADTVLRIAANCTGQQQGFKYSLVARDGHMLASGIETDYQSLLANVFGAMRVSADTSTWQIQDQEQRYYQALVALDQYANEQSINDAIKMLEELKEQDTANRTRIISALGLAWYLKFNLSQQSEDQTKASTYCDQVSGSHSIEALIRCGVVLTGTKNTPAAIINFESALRERPNDPEAVLGLAEAYENAGDAGKAEQFYQQAVSLRPDYWAGYNELGGFYFEHGRYKEAETCLLTVTNLLPLNPYGWSNLGNTQLYQGHFDAAQASFNQSLRQQRTPDTLMNLGISLLYQNRCSEAADAFEQGTKLNSNEAELWGLLGDAYRCTPEHHAQANAAYDKAIELITDRLKTDDSQSSNHALLAEWLAKRGRNEQAIGHIAKALAVAPDEPFTLLSAVKVYYMTGRVNLALDFASKAAQNANSRFDMMYAPELAQLRANPAYQSIANSFVKEREN